MDRVDREIDFLIKKISTATEEDFELPRDALVFILFEYSAYEISSAIRCLPRRNKIKIAEGLHDLDEVAFRNGLSLKLKSIEASIESRCLRYFWGYKWLQNAGLLLGCLALWGLGRLFDWSKDEANLFLALFIFATIKKVSHDVFRQNELLIQEVNKTKFTHEMEWIKANLKEHDWFVSDR